MPALWTELARCANRDLSEQQEAALSSFLDLLSAANERMNLTRIVDRASAEVQHIGDALTLLPYLPDGPFDLVDIGSGGGVPGIPLAISRPDARIVLVESTKKKAAYLTQTIAELRLGNVQVRAQRAEEAGVVGQLRERADVVVARGVGAMVWLAEWCLPMVRVGGRFLAMKGQKAAEELVEAAKAIRMLGGGTPTIHPIILPGTEHRVVIEIRKTGKSDSRYPRQAPIAKGRPLV